MRLTIFLFFIVGLAIFSGCGHKNNSESAGTPKIEPEDFMAMFRTLSPPLAFSDTVLAKKPGDSLMHWDIYSQFLPDSLIQKYFGKSVKPKLYASGKLVVKKAETYVFIKAITPAKKAMFLICFNSEEKFSTGMPVLLRDEHAEMRYTASVDNKYAISVIRTRKDQDGKSLFIRTVYVYNSEGVFTLIMTESNEGKSRSAQIYNPIDTLSHKHKFTGDYFQDKRNFISVRDGKNNSVFRFFVHFEKDDGKCKGELKGEAHFVNANIARYSSNGDPCSLEFSFNDKNVRLKELEGCGNHRDIRCFFEGIYPRHKENIPKPAKSKRR